jgi:hypothetical protein
VTAPTYDDPSVVTAPEADEAVDPGQPWSHPLRRAVTLARTARNESTLAVGFAAMALRRSPGRRLLGGAPVVFGAALAAGTWAHYAVPGGGTPPALAVFVVLPAAALLVWAVRLRQALHRTNVSTLRVAGATPGQIRLVAVVDAALFGLVGALPASVGAVVGGSGSIGWDVVAVLMLTGVVTGCAGLTASVTDVGHDLGWSRALRRQPIGLVLTLVGVAVGLVAPVRTTTGGGVVTDPVRLVGCVAAAVGLATLMPYVLERLGLAIADRGGTGGALLTGRRIAASAGRTAWVHLPVAVLLAMVSGALLLRVTGAAPSAAIGMPLSAAAYRTLGDGAVIALGAATVGMITAAVELWRRDRRGLATLRAGGTSRTRLRRVLVTQFVLPSATVLGLAVAAGVLMVGPAIVLVPSSRTRDAALAVPAHSAVPTAGYPATGTLVVLLAVAAGLLLVAPVAAALLTDRRRADGPVDLRWE